MASSENIDTAQLEAQSATLLSVFAAAGYIPVRPEILQPADVFLNVVGESLRGRTYVFADPDGEELCLRPDLTVPTCLIYLDEHPSCDARKRYSYHGSAFRFQPGGTSERHPREFRQLGIELFGETDHERAEAEVVSLTLEAVRKAGLNDMQLRLGDLGLFRALLQAIEMPERWRDQLIHDFWRRDTLRERLRLLTTAHEERDIPVPRELVEKLDPGKPDAAEEIVSAYMASENIPLFGARSLGEITEHLLAYAADANQPPLAAETAKLIEAYVGVKAPPKAVAARISDMISEQGIDLSDALGTFKRRIAMFEEAGIDMGQAEFSAEFGRNLEYYSGFVFQIERPGDPEHESIAGGGRYDSLMRAVGAPHDVPGIGVAIHAERLLESVAAQVKRSADDE